MRKIQPGLKLIGTGIISFLVILVFSSYGLSGGTDPGSGIEGKYRFKEDQPSNISSKQGALILLDIQPGGKMFLNAEMPGESLRTEGSYELNKGLMTIHFPEFKKKAKNKPWSLKKNILLLPLQFIGEGPGFSKWEKVDPGEGPISRFFEVLNQGLKQGQGLENSVRKAAEATMERSLKLKKKKGFRGAITSYDIWDDQDIVMFNFDNGKREAVIVSMAPENTQPKVLLPKSPLSKDPRTHIPAWPKTSPDDPKSKTAILFAPFNTTTFYGYKVHEEKKKWRIPHVSFGWTHCFRWKGEDLHYIAEKLRRCHYRVKVLANRAATPKALYDECLKLNKEGGPGILYIGTHGGAGEKKMVILASGVCLSESLSEKSIHDRDQDYQKLVKKYVPQKFLDDVGPALVVDRGCVFPIWGQKMEGVPVCFLAMDDSFFRRMREEDGMDFSDSFVFANGCETVKNPDLVQAVKARMFLGNKDKTTMKGTMTEGLYLFHLLTKPTFSVREIVGLIRFIVNKRICIFYPEDDWLAATHQRDNQVLTLYGSDLKECELPDFNVLYLCWLGRWNSRNPEGGCRTLQNVYDEFWSKGTFSRLKSVIANAGVRGTHVPTEKEMLFATHLVCGVPLRKGGRFTLNDANPKRKKKKK